jgi:hypothetical protein
MLAFLSIGCICGCLVAIGFLGLELRKLVPVDDLVAAVDVDPGNIVREQALEADRVGRSQALRRRSGDFLRIAA